MNELPKFYHRLFHWFCNPDYYEELQGDLEEAFLVNQEEYGIKKAQNIYRKEVIKMIRPSVLKHTQKLNQHIMSLPKNYLKTSLRAIKLHPFYVMANLVGLALALSICTIAYFNYRYNITYNTYFENAENIYKINGLRTGQSDVGYSSIAVAAQLQNDGIKAGRYLKRNLTVKDGQRLFNSSIAFVDQSFQDLFQFKNIDKQKVKVPQANEIVISEALALKLFNESYPVGEFIKIVFPSNEEGAFQIVDVMQKPPTNTSFHQSALLPLESYLHYYGAKEQDWSRLVNGTFLQASSSELGSLTAKLDSYLSIRNENNPSLQIEGYRFDNLLEWPAIEGRLYSSGFRQHKHATSVLGITGSAIAILLLACFNFINTSIALSGKRLKEIAVRKILGGTRKSTTIQFLIENTFMITMAILISFGITYLLIPQYNALMRSESIQMNEIPYLDMMLFSVGIIALVTILAAAYPSFYISQFSALKIFQKKLALSGKNMLMAVLLTFQFALCFYNIFGLFFNSDNVKYQAELDRGYDITQVVNIPLNRTEQYRALENALLENPNILQVSGTRNLIGFSNEKEFVSYEGIEQSVSIIKVGKDYPETLGLRINTGDYFEGLEDDSPQVIINSMLQDSYSQDLLNQYLVLGDAKYRVVGIVDDFNLRPIMGDNKIAPTVIKLVSPEFYFNVSAKITGSAEEVNDQIEDIWYSLYPGELYEGFAQELVMKNAEELNKVFFKINFFLAMITILVSVLGLYTLISLKIQRKSKEFGVRKVLGASKLTIVHLLGKDLYWMIAIAAVLGLSGGAWVLSTVYDIIYAYHVVPTFGHIFQTTLVVVFIIVTTVGFQVYKASLLNPTQQLRSE